MEQSPADRMNDGDKDITKSDENTDTVGTTSDYGVGFKMPMMSLAAGLKRKSAGVAAAFSDGNETSTEPPSKTAAVETKKPPIPNLPVPDEPTPNNETKKKENTSTPAELLKELESPIPYKEPAWGGLTEKEYFFEAVKNGIVTDKVDLTTKSFFVFGRLPSCDHSMDHPSLSRYHAVVQYRTIAGDDHDPGWYLYDLDSTHGTWINKNKVKPRIYYRLRVGYVVKFGGSSRLYILQGPDTDQDVESQLSVTELKEQRERQKKETEVLRQLGEMEAQESALRRLKSENDTGCSWGLDDDDLTEADDGVNPFALPEPLQEELYIDDPKKALKGFFEREGCDLPEYEFLEEGKGKLKCRVELPIDTINGEPVYAMVTVDGKKKDAVVQCALEACRILDRQGVLRKAMHEGRAKKKKVPTATLR